MSNLLPQYDGVEFGKHEHVKKFMKGIFNLKPSLSKYSKIWDIKQLSDYYRSLPDNHDLDLKTLTLKLSTIFVILLCQREHTIETLDLNYITLKDIEIHIAFPSALKLTRPGKHLQPLTLYEYPTEPKLCPVSLLRCYISKTQTIRKSQTKLLLKFYKATQGRVNQDLSRWLKTSLKNAGININIYQGHSLRTASASTASLHGLNIQSILKAGGWSRELTFSKYYKKDLLIDQSLQFYLF